jgi:ankyrin repeat protein
VVARLSAGPLRDAYLDSERRGWTALMQHVCNRDEGAVARAIAEGADLDSIAEGADTALSLACASGADAIAEMLIAAGADPKARARHDLTLLHLAAAHSSMAVIRGLVEAGARIETVRDVCPLSVAIECDRSEVLA